MLKEERREMFEEILAGLAILAVLVGVGVGVRTWYTSPGHKLAQRLALVEDERMACEWTCAGQDEERCLQDCRAVARVRIEGETTLALNEMSPVPTTNGGK